MLKNSSFNFFAIILAILVVGGALYYEMGRDEGGQESPSNTADDVAYLGDDIHPINIYAHEYNDAQSLKKILQQHKTYISLQKTQMIKNKAVSPLVFNQIPRPLIDGNLSSQEQKNMFISVILPLILISNLEIDILRDFVFFMRELSISGEIPSQEQQQKLSMLFSDYDVENGDFISLLMRIAPLPIDLALAQAAIESGWGRSRFLQQGNALFGQWTNADYDGLIPTDRDENAQHKIRRFDTLLQSVQSYMRNLNTHPAYNDFREMRWQYIQQGESLSGMKLVDGLHPYSEKGEKYIKQVKQLITSNRLFYLNDSYIIQP
jgi:Bax protein